MYICIRHERTFAVSRVYNGFPVYYYDLRPRWNASAFGSRAALAIDAVCANTRDIDDANVRRASFAKGQVSRGAHRARRGTSTDLYDAQNERAVLEVVLEAEVDLADVLARFRIIDVHVDQRDGPTL